MPEGFSLCSRVRRQDYQRQRALRRLSVRCTGTEVKGGCVLSFAKENTPPFGWQPPRPALHHHPVQRAKSRRTEHRYANTLCKDAKRPPAKSPVAFIFTLDNNKI